MSGEDDRGFDGAATMELARTWAYRTQVMREQGGGVDLSAAPLEQLTVGERYADQERIGEGGMGEVLVALDRQIARQVAVKRIQPEYCDQPHAQRRFVREARVQGQLEHPSIVPVYDLGLDETGHVYFTMKRIRGVTLEEVLLRLAASDPPTCEKWSRSRILSVFGTICLAVDFAHAQGVVHRDIKPGNVMLGDFGEVYLLDWGLAKVWHKGEVVHVGVDSTVAGVVLGTPGYMSPEQARGTGYYGPESDVYSLGAVLYEILTLAPLHSGPSAEEVLEATLRGGLARPSLRAPEAEVPPELEAICVKATEVDPRERFSTARELHDAVERYLDGQRDVELRSEMSRRHTAAAVTAFTRPHDDVEQVLLARREAVRELGRALALDPANDEALQAMSRILGEEPPSVPPEVDEALEAANASQRRWTAGAASVAYLSMFAYLPFFLWAGVESWGLVVAYYVGVSITAAVSLWTFRSRSPSVALPLTVMVLSNASFAVSTVLFGPLVLMPAMVAVNTVAFAIHFDGWHRRLAVAVGCLAIAVPVGLEAVGLVAPSYIFVDGSMTIVPRAIGLPPVPTLLFLTIGSVACVVTGSLSVGRVRDGLSAAERKLYLHTWHLSQLLPGSPDRR